MPSAVKANFRDQAGGSITVVEFLASQIKPTFFQVPHPFAPPPLHSTSPPPLLPAFPSAHPFYSPECFHPLNDPGGTTLWWSE